VAASRLQLKIDILRTRPSNGTDALERMTMPGRGHQRVIDHMTVRSHSQKTISDVTTSNFLPRLSVRETFCCECRCSGSDIQHVMLVGLFRSVKNAAGCRRLDVSSSQTKHLRVNNKLCAWRHNMPPPPASWQYLRIYSPGGTCSSMLAI